MKAILLSIAIAITSLTSGGIERIDHSTLDNSTITHINGEAVEGYEVSDRYKDYEHSIDFYTGEDSGIVVFYTKDLTDIRVIDNR